MSLFRKGCNTTPQVPEGMSETHIANLGPRPAIFLKPESISRSAHSVVPANAGTHNHRYQFYEDIPTAPFR